MTLALFPVVVVAALAAFLGWRMGLRPAVASGPDSSDGMPKALLLAVSATSLALVFILLLPWVAAMPRLLCPGGFDAGGRCVDGASQASLIGLLFFVSIAFTATTFVVRRGVVDPLVGVSPIEAMEKLPVRVHAVEDDARPERAAAGAHAEEDAHAAEDVEEARPSELSEERPSSKGVWVDGRPATLDEALVQVVRYLGAESTAVVFSGHVEHEANVALERIAEKLGSARFVIGTYDVDREVEGIAGRRAGHESELALALAASAMRSVLLIDTKVEFNPVVLQMMGSIQGICLTTERDPVASACAVVLPADDRVALLSRIHDELG